MPAGGNGEYGKKEMKVNASAENDQDGRKSRKSCRDISSEHSEKKRYTNGADHV